MMKTRHTLAALALGLATSLGNVAQANISTESFYIGSGSLTDVPAAPLQKRQTLEEALRLLFGIGDEPRDANHSESIAPHSRVMDPTLNNGH